MPSITKTSSSTTPLFWTPKIEVSPNSSLIFLAFEILTDFIHGNLHNMMKQFGPFKENRVALNLNQILEAVSYLHRNEYICQ